MDKHESLNQFLDKHSHLSVQGSEEWHKARSGIVGSSEISAILGKNQYMDKNKLALSKLGLNEIKDKFPIMWGNVFEDIANYAVSQIMETKIYSAGSVRGYEYNGRVINATSPDGLGIITHKILQKHINNGHIIDNRIIKNNEELYYTLFEYKVPAIRCPKVEPKQMYIPQIMSGMVTCNAEIALFCDALIRPCSIEQFKFNHEVINKFNNPYGNITLPEVEPLYMGYLIFYENEGDDGYINYDMDVIYDKLIKDENFINFLPDVISTDIIRLIRYIRNKFSTSNLYIIELLLIKLVENNYLICQDTNSQKPKREQKNITRNIIANVIDTYKEMEDEIRKNDIKMLSDERIQRKRFHEFFTNCKVDNPLGHYDVYYSELINRKFMEDRIDETDNTIDWFVSDSNMEIRNLIEMGHKPVAIMPYKLLDIKMNLFDKDSDYVENIASDLYSFLENLDYCRGEIHDDMDYSDKVEIINKYFPLKIKKKRKTKKDYQEEQIDNILDNMI